MEGFRVKPSGWKAYGALKLYEALQGHKAF